MRCKLDADPLIFTVITIMSLATRKAEYIESKVVLKNAFPYASVLRHDPRCGLSDRNRHSNRRYSDIPPQPQSLSGDKSHRRLERILLHQFFIQELFEDHLLRHSFACERRAMVVAIVGLAAGFEYVYEVLERGLERVKRPGSRMIAVAGLPTCKGGYGVERSGNL